MLRQLIDRGFVAVSISAGDARRREYALTGRGEKKMAELKAARESAMEAVWDGLEPKDVERFARFGAGLADRLGSYAERVEAAEDGHR